MKLIHFLNEFPDEESCELSIKSYREKTQAVLENLGTCKIPKTHLK